MSQTREHSKAVYYDLLQVELDKKTVTLPISLESKYTPIFVVRVAKYDPSTHSPTAEPHDFFSQVQIAAEKGAKNLGQHRIILSQSTAKYSIAK